MTAADNLAEAADLAKQTARYEAAIDRHTHTGQVFDYAQPLPPLPDHRPRAEWGMDIKAKEPSEWPLTNTAATTQM